MGLSNVPWEWDYPMCPGKELANVLCEWASQSALGMRPAEVPWEWD